MCVCYFRRPEQPWRKIHDTISKQKQIHSVPRYKNVHLCTDIVTTTIFNICLDWTVSLFHKRILIFQNRAIVSETLYRYLSSLNPWKWYPVYFLPISLSALFFPSYESGTFCCVTTTPRCYLAWGTHSLALRSTDVSEHSTILGLYS